MPQNQRSLGRTLQITILVTVAGLFAFMLLNRPDEKPQADPPANANTDQAIHLTFDLGDGQTKSAGPFPWKAEMTVLDGLSLASEGPEGIRFVHRGTGATAFVSSIADLENQGGENGKNWIFKVNGTKSTKSAGVHVLQSGDKVLWKFSSEIE